MNKTLNEQQQKAIQYINGPLLVLAGAGSGKTTVLEKRIVHMLDQGIKGENILAITFTNQAANEMKRRLSEAVDIKISNSLNVSTIHALCSSILSKESFNTFTIEGRNRLRSITNSLCKEKFKKENIHVDNILDIIGSLKRELISSEMLLTLSNLPLDVQKRANSILFSISREERTIVQKLYPLLEKTLRNEHIVDFDSLIFETVQLFKNFPQLLDKYQELFRFILIDEFQDLNFAQYYFVQMLASKYRNICGIGDDNQSIMSFQGSDIKRILSFEEIYPDATIITLEQNYRSTQTIVELAKQLISNNAFQFKKNMFTEKDWGNDIVVCDEKNLEEEVKYIASKIKQKINEGYTYKDIAILARTNETLNKIEHILVEKNPEIPFKNFSSSLFSFLEIRMLIHLLKFVRNPKDEQSFSSFVQFFYKGIGEKTIEKLIDKARDENISLLTAIQKMDELKRIAKKQKESLRLFASSLELFLNEKETLPISYLLQEYIQENHYLSTFNSSDTYKARKLKRENNIQMFLHIIEHLEKENPTISLDELLTKIFDEICEPGTVDEQFVKLMTVHSSKGLQFPVVFLSSMVEGVFPITRLNTEYEEEEERRVCYVGITRAEKELIITYHNETTIVVDGNEIVINTKPSRFIDEMLEDESEALLLELSELDLKEK